VVILGDLLADEFGNSGSFLSHWEIDRRDIPLDTNWLESIFNRLATARIALEWEAARLQMVEPTNTQIGDLLTRAGFLYLAYAQNWCSGVPLDDPNVGVSTADLLNLAVTRFDEATAGPISPDFLTAAEVGRARAYQGLGDYAAAAASAATVPTTFSWGISHTAASGDQNPVFLYNRQSRRISVQDVEGGTGLPFRSAGDPRVPWTREDGGTAIGTDGVTPHYDLLKYPAADTPMPLATGLEARLIQAEALLQLGDQAGYVNQLNTVRAFFGLPDLTIPATIPESVDLLFEERAFSLFATGQRLWDLRRLVSVYGRSAASVFPSGTTIQGGTYGTDGNLPVPLSARGPSYSGCTVRTH
jgi:hypothetical protein